MKTVRVSLKNGKQLSFPRAIAQEKVWGRLIIVDEFYRIVAEFHEKEIVKLEHEEVPELKTGS